MQTAYINRVATAVPPYDVHEAFRRFAQSMLHDDRRNSLLFQRMADKSGIEHRYSCLAPSNLPEGDRLDAEGFYLRCDFPDTAARMQKFEQHAPLLAQRAVDMLQLGADRDRITHLVVTCCTGFSAPGLVLELVERCSLSSKVERTVVGFMGCYAAINALKLAHHIVRSEASARVLIVNLELCTLHLQDTTDLEQMLLFLLFGDGCAASVVSAEPVGVALDSFHAVLVPNTRELITWNIGDSGFDMTLSGRVPAAIHDGMRVHADEILAGASTTSIDLWAVHPGGRTVLDAVERALELPPAALAESREILRRYGNMSSATVMFVLNRLLGSGACGRTGCAMSFGPGLIAETLLFHTAA
ncbi:putative naringenin-chalcone synthase [Mesorhizobium soli]|uniref:type III polyketide synthase n=1 Tax=Pseudaminobacter soli (ex Li et al. 2025) TaxID=1295366 RepID=UPI00247592B6|nr:type III polyketide synthase [Mesorhizobium soli]MDH6231789.1 putative naringenin-chalcone synthase [Mesorhizobium soli]